MSMIVKKRKPKSKVKVITKEMIEQQYETIKTTDVRVTMIQELIPLGLRAVHEELYNEVERLAGGRYEHDHGASRWGKQPGSVYLGDEKYRIEVPRLRDREKRKEIPLASYESLQRPRQIDEGILKKILLGLSTHRYDDAARMAPEGFGLSASTVSRRYIRGSAKKLKHLLERSLAGDDFVAIFVDGKSFSKDQMMIAVGITIEGDKKILGIVHVGTESERALVEFFESLTDRGLCHTEGILFVVDGSKGLLKAIESYFKGYAVIQRCQWHKRENVVSYLAKESQELFRKKLRSAYHKTTYESAKRALLKIHEELLPINQSAARSLMEGIEETLTLHRLGIFKELSRSFKTTNVLESINARVGQSTDKVDYWRNSNQKLRWTATALLDIEPRLRKIKGTRYLYKLRLAIKRELNLPVKKKGENVA